MIISSTSVFAENRTSDIRVTVNGRIVKCEELYGQSAVVIDDIPLIPLAAITDSLSMTSEWDEEGKVVTFANETASVSLNAADNTIVLDGETIKLKDIDGTAMISSDALDKVFGLTLTYNQEKGSISVKAKPVKDNNMVNTEAETPNKESQKKGNVFLTVVGAMTEGFVVTLKLFAVTLIGALPLGLVIALCSMSKFLPLKYLTRLLVWIIRGTPLMLQLLIIFYIPGMALEGGSPWPKGEEGRFMAASIAFIINYAFYFSEIYRGGIEGIPKGQVEAGQVLGMTKTQIFFNVTLLQMIKRIVPPMSNEIITLVKDTSIARIISLQEVIWAGYAFLKSSHGYSGLLWPLFFTGVYYLLFNGILTILFGKIEKKLSYFN